MFIMTAKVDLRKILLAVLAAAAAIGILLAVAGHFGGPAPASAPADSNDARVKYLEQQGWRVTVSPKETQQVRIPREPDEVFTRYNALQKSQGFDLARYAGKTVQRYVYTVENFPGATEPVYASVLVWKDRIIGGDITDTAPGGKIRGLVQAAPSEPQG